MRLIIQPDCENVSRWAANYLAARVSEFNPTAGWRLVWGLPRGS